jgi:hypothetical protein
LGLPIDNKKYVAMVVEGLQPHPTIQTKTEVENNLEKNRCCWEIYSNQKNTDDGKTTVQEYP